MVSLAIMTGKSRELEHVLDEPRQMPSLVKLAGGTKL